MSEELKTIKEIADELGVSKQNVRYHMKFLPVNKTVKNDKGQVVLNSEEQLFIKDRTKVFTSKSDTDFTGTKNPFSSKEKQRDVVKYSKIIDEKELLYEKLLKEKDKQIYDLKSSRDKQLIAKDEQIKSLVEAQKQTQNLLDQQQRLALQDKKLLEEYKAEINDLKALKMPTEDRKEEQAINQSQSELEALKSEITALQEQLNEQVTIEPQEVPKKWWQFWK